MYIFVKHKLSTMDIGSVSLGSGQITYVPRNVFIVLQRTGGSFVAAFTSRTVLYTWILEQGTAYIELNRRIVPITGYHVIAKYFQKHTSLAITFVKPGTNKPIESEYFEVIKAPLVNNNKPV
jgi:hypothetical protein